MKFNRMLMILAAKLDLTCKNNNKTDLALVFNSKPKIDKFKYTSCLYRFVLPI
jgi:hypothetical protein